MTLVGNLILFLVIVVQNVLSANILYINPIASPSHHIWNRALAIGLVEKGHNVTLLSHDKEKLPPPKNFTVITIEGMYDVMYNVIDMEEFAEQGPFSVISALYEFTLFACEFDYNATAVKYLLNYPKDFKFDLIIVDATCGRCLYPLIERFHNPPVVAVTPFLVPPVLQHVFEGHLYTSYVPFYGSTYTNRMNLIERTVNFLYTYAEILYRNYIYLPREKALMKQNFPENVFSLDELERNISLLLCNFDPVMEYPMALPPNIIPVGGLHARPAQPLPKDLNKIMDEASNGVILFSLGTNVRSDKLDLKTKLSLLEAFSKLPQIVLWKFESDIQGLPKNVIVRKWLPQNDILGHPNTKLFISHVGGLSTQEAIYHAVPVVGIPFFTDQYINVIKMEEKGVAKFLDRKNLTTENVFGAVHEILTSTKYSENMRSLSKKYHDQPHTALERGVFWIEYLLRHGSAEHLNSAARDMPNYQTANLDVLAFFLLCVILIYAVVQLIVTGCRFIFSIRGHSVKVKSTK